MESLFQSKKNENPNIFSLKVHSNFNTMKGNQEIRDAYHIPVSYDMTTSSYGPQKSLPFIVISQITL